MAKSFLNKYFSTNQIIFLSFLSLKALIVLNSIDKCVVFGPSDTADSLIQKTHISIHIKAKEKLSFSQNKLSGSFG